MKTLACALLLLLLSSCYCLARRQVAVEVQSPTRTATLHVWENPPNTIKSTGLWFWGTVMSLGLYPVDVLHSGLQFVSILGDDRMEFRGGAIAGLGAVFLPGLTLLSWDLSWGLYDGPIELSEEGFDAVVAACREGRGIPAVEEVAMHARVPDIDRIELGIGPSPR